MSSVSWLSSAPRADVRYIVGWWFEGISTLRFYASRQRAEERERPSTSEHCYVSGTIAIRVNKLWSVCHIHEAARVHQPRSTLLSGSPCLNDSAVLSPSPCLSLSVERTPCFLVFETLTLYNQATPVLSSLRSILFGVYRCFHGVAPITKCW